MTPAHASTRIARLIKTRATVRLGRTTAGRPIAARRGTTTISPSTKCYSAAAGCVPGRRAPTSFEPTTSFAPTTAPPSLSRLLRADAGADDGGSDGAGLSPCPSGSARYCAPARSRATRPGRTRCHRTCSRARRSLGAARRSPSRRARPSTWLRTRRPNANRQGPATTQQLTQSSATYQKTIVPAATGTNRAIPALGWVAAATARARARRTIPAAITTIQPPRSVPRHRAGRPSTPG